MEPYPKLEKVQTLFEIMSIASPFDAQSLDDVPESIRNYEPGDAYGNFVDDKGHHLWNQRLPGGYHLTVDEVNGPVNLHFDAHDPLQGSIENFKHWYHEVKPINVKNETSKFAHNHYWFWLKTCLF